MLNKARAIWPLRGGDLECALRTWQLGIGHDEASQTKGSVSTQPERYQGWYIWFEDTVGVEVEIPTTLSFVHV